MNDDDHKLGWHQDGVAIQEATPKLKKPPMFNVFLLNDDFTPMEFVVELLEKFFFHSKSNATRIMFEIHNQGKGICGTYTEDIAATKTDLVNRYSQEHGHPLRCEYEPCNHKEP